MIPMEPKFDHVEERHHELPLVSTVGTGPRGRGVYPVTLVDSNGEFMFALKDDITNQVIWESSNLSAGVISVEDNVVKVRQGGSVHEYPLDISEPEAGSRISFRMQLLPAALMIPTLSPKLTSVSITRAAGPASQLFARMTSCSRTSRNPVLTTWYLVPSRP